jgi:hypothetical protein
MGECAAKCFARPSVVRLRQCGRYASQPMGADKKGSTSVSPAIHLKSSVLRVTSVAPCVKAVAAMSESPSLVLRAWRRAMAYVTTCSETVRRSTLAKNSARQSFSSAVSSW